MSALGNEFSYNFNVSFPDDRTTDSARHNFTLRPAGEEHAGLSAFALLDGVVYHTYSCYARGLEAFSPYQLLDRAPKGRDERALTPPNAWMRRHDQDDSPTTKSSGETQR